jgi:hypothetical protein
MEEGFTSVQTVKILVVVAGLEKYMQASRLQEK